MVYSSGATSTFTAAKPLLFSPSNNNNISSRKIETSDPTELDEAYIVSELGLNVDSTASDAAQGGGPVGRDGDEKKPFAKPRGPVRRK